MKQFNVVLQLEITYPSADFADEVVRAFASTVSPVYNKRGKLAIDYVVDERTHAYTFTFKSSYVRHRAAKKYMRRLHATLHAQGIDVTLENSCYVPRDNIMPNW